MSFLYPLFLAGIAAIGLPILLHMIRQHTRHRVTFSSLMFLRATMPRFRNRSRIENLPLLILRCLILCLLALAFSRPFFAKPIEESEGSLGKRIVLLVDTSASMRRPGMWTQAINQASSALRDIRPSDRVCVMTFDRDVQTLLGFEQWEALDPAQRATAAIESLSDLSPGWNATNLGAALITAAEAIEDDEVNVQQQPVGSRQIVLVSDLQQGSDIDALRTYEWPQGLALTLKAVASPGATNAALQIVANRDPLAAPSEDERTSIRVTNSAEATFEQFQLHWASDAATSEPERSVDVYVPPGNSGIVRTPEGLDAGSARRLILTGDDQDFDNTLYLAPHLKQQINILYLGNDDPNDTKDTLFYVRRAFSATGATRFSVTAQRSDAPLTDADMDAAHVVIVTDAIGQDDVATLRRYLERGRMALLVMKSEQAGDALARLAGAGNLEYREAEVNRYAMLSRLEYSHPLLAPFSDPRFGDFTRVHFWKYRGVTLDNYPQARVLAWFDTNHPAWFEVPVGQGTLLVFTCGWQPADSDLALSSKFVPLLYSVLEYGGVLTGRQLQYFIGDPVPLSFGVPPSDGSEPRKRGTPNAATVVRKPDDSVVSLDATEQAFTQTDLPGIYRVESAGGERLFAINLAPQESRTDPMPIEDLENLGVVQSAFGGPAVANAAAVAQAKRVNDLVRMEEQQKLWRWVLVLVLAVLLVETWLAGWLTRVHPVETQDLASPPSPGEQ
ncbi:MAG: BatA domain-containing protein [Sedimentisphaerales bacterium]|nr:BatA domain-containing protein [Sedimentisphaerales bacterium]